MDELHKIHYMSLFSTGLRPMVLRVLEILIYVTISIKIITLIKDLGLYYKNIYDTIDGASVKFSNKIYNDSQL